MNATSKAAFSPRTSGIAAAVARYYAEFLATDFKAARHPRRSFERKTGKGILVGAELGRYPELATRIHRDLCQSGNPVRFEVRRGSCRTELPPMVRRVLDGAIERIDQAQLNRLATGIAEIARRLVTGGEMDVELFREEVLMRAGRHIQEQLAGGLLDNLAEHLKNSANRPAEDLQSLSKGIADRLLADLREKCVDSLATLVVKDDHTDFRTLLGEHFEPAATQDALRDYFESFIAGDLYVELTDMQRSQRMLENTTFLLYIGTVKVDGSVYPMAFQRLELTEGASSITLQADSQLYINKQAFDYAAEQSCAAAGIEPGPSPISDRIHYLDGQHAPMDILQHVLDSFAPASSLRLEREITAAPEAVLSSTPTLTLGNHIYIALAEKPDESILNDYESLYSGVNCDSASVAFFEEMVADFMTRNPLSVHDRVEREWEESSLSDRLVFESPLPLAEEQRKILKALEIDEARYLAVEGPPGTGKSHTITAIAFNAILNNKSLLILSDKAEALDVVEDKLNEALRKVRHKEDFQNPILRLGRANGNYNRLMKKSTIDSLEISRRMGRNKEATLREERQREINELRSALEESASIAGQLEMTAIAEVQALESKLLTEHHHLQELAEDMVVPVLEDFRRVSPFLAEHRDRLLTMQGIARGSLNILRRARKVEAMITSNPPLRAPESSVIPSLKVEQLAELKHIMVELESTRGLFGYLFAGKHLERIAHKLSELTGSTVRAPHKIRSELSDIIRAAQTLLSRMEAWSIDQSEFSLAYELLLNGGLDAPIEVAIAAERLEQTAEEGHPLLPMEDGQPLLRALLLPDTPQLEPLRRLAYVRDKSGHIHDLFQRMPQIDYLGAKTRIEALYTHELAGVIDERLIRFYHQSRADAKTIGDVIRNRGRFPVEKFGMLQEAFPCMIAGLREYAEYVPLQRGIFDIVIIDEGSQVSIAQAMPAILRAKKMVVLGDRKQFGNVKTALASKAINNGHMEALRQAFAAWPQSDNYTQQRLERFNIKSSVMDWFDLVANYSIQLRKHFRSYPEMIGFSSKHFYESSLQTMKIRGKPINEVIQFHGIEHDGKIDRSANTNELEIEHILKELEKLLDDDKPYTAGVITPHSEQATLFSRRLSAHPRQAEMRDRLRLKVMNFDSCQGEERDVIFYSLVATREKDRLAHIFPASMDSAADDIEYNLRLQRLNVGFSRAKERIVIVHSKPLDEYKSAIKTALFHYQSALTRAQQLPAPGEVDPNSPMELKVLGWLSQAPIIQELGRWVEVHAQFPMGDYLRSLDPTYDHPAYRVDFLLRINAGREVHHLVVEYDGFEYHFKTDRRREIDQGNWQSYLTESDIERERVLESFGVKMIRLNRFVLKGNPVQVIDELLRQRLEHLRAAADEHELLEQTKNQASEAETGLSEGTHKHCKKCDSVKPLETFRANEAKSGYGRLCSGCRQ